MGIHRRGGYGMSRLIYALSNYCELGLTRKDVSFICVGGDNDAQVQTVLNKPYVKRQLAQIDKAAIVKNLQEYGCWDDVELQDYAANCARFVWLSAWSINDETK